MGASGPLKGGGGRTGGSLGGRIEGRRRKKPRVEPGIPKAGEVTVTRVDGSVEKIDPLTKKQATSVIRKGQRKL